MKFEEIRFEDYIREYKKNDLHPFFQNKLQQFPKKMIDMRHTIIYGPPGVGKYTRALALAQKYSTSKLKYIRKIHISYLKTHTYIIYISVYHNIHIILIIICL